MPPAVFCGLCGRPFEEENVLCVQAELHARVAALSRAKVKEVPAEKKGRTRGRPSGSTSPDTRRHRYAIRLNDDERDRLERLASMHAVAVSEWLRRRGLMLRAKK